MKNALIWYTWFVWSNLDSQYDFEYKYNSKNIGDIDGESFDLVVCAWVKAVKWYANQHPEEDEEGINSLIKHLKTIKTEKFVLISTIDVYPEPFLATEDSVQNFQYNQPYWKNRYNLEEFVKKTFNDYLIIRLPWLFGKNIKKNVIFDLLNNNQTEKIITNASFQYYCLDNLREDIQVCIDNNLKIVNFATEPLETQEIVDKFFPESSIWSDVENPVKYDFRTKYDKLFWWDNWYIYNKKQILNDLDNFICDYKNLWN